MLREITIPESIEEIGEESFANCIIMKKAII